MHVINAVNVNDALHAGLRHLQDFGHSEPSRNGTVRVAPHPVTTVYARPEERVLFSPLRNANPFFHYLESLWMLSGRQDVQFPARYAAQMQLYSDDNATLNGAYGYRWRNHFGYDQLRVVIEELKVNPSSRRCVVAMWDAQDHSTESMSVEARRNYTGDLQFAIAGSKDVPCNTQIFFRILGGRLDMTVLCRSNDAIWGTYGANAVHFSVLQEYMASQIGIGIGLYYQVANNFHIYTDRPDVNTLLEGVYVADDRYRNAKLNVVRRLPMFQLPEVADDELHQFMSDPVATRSYHNNAFKVGNVMARAHFMYKDGHLPEAIHFLAHIDIDWCVAGREWLERILDARRLKETA